HRAALAQSLSEASRVVFPPDRPAEAERRNGQARKRAPEVGVDALAPERQRLRGTALTRSDQPLALGFPPGFHVVGGHGRGEARRSLQSRDSANRSQASMLLRWRVF